MATDDFVVNIAGEGGPLRIDLEANVSLGTVEWSPSHTHRILLRCLFLKNGHRKERGGGRVKRPSRCHLLIRVGQPTRPLGPIYHVYRRIGRGAGTT